MSESEAEPLSRISNVSLHYCCEPGCNAKFSRPSRLKTHQLSHSGERPFKCTHCEKDFTRNAHLKRHILINHEGQKTPTQQLECDECGEFFSNKYSLQKHVKKFHMVKQYSCSECGLRFHKHHLLRAHQTVHTGSLPWTCSQCSKSFQYEMYLKRHSRIHQQYKCKDCDAVFARWSDLQQHKATEHPPTSSHLRFPCPQCDKIFKENGILKRHQLIHAETREVFQCPREFCHRYFYFKNNLNNHIKSYHDGKKYFCSENDCRQKFFSRQRMQDHIKSVHQNLIPVVKKPVKRGELRQRRKDKGKFKKPMALVLSGFNNLRSKTEMQELINDEVRSLDKVEALAHEAANYVDSSSEAASEDDFLLDNRKKVDPPSQEEKMEAPLLGVVRRPGSEHFLQMWAEESDTTDLEMEVKPETPVKNTPQTRVDFSKFLKS